jgi:hypothetical protein
VLQWVCLCWASVYGWMHGGGHCRAFD